MATVSGSYTSATQYSVTATGLTTGQKYRLFVQDLDSDNQPNGKWYCHYAGYLTSGTQISSTRAVSYTGQRIIRLYKGEYSDYTATYLYDASALPPISTHLETTATIPAYSGSTTTYKVFFVSNAGGDTVGSMPSTITFASGERVVIPYATPTRSGYNFLGWSQLAASTTPQYTAGDVVGFSGNTNLYAVWEEVVTYSLKFAQTYSGVINMPTDMYGITSGTWVTISSKVPELTGYTFLGWSKTLGGTAQYQPSGNIYITEDVLLYTVFERKEIDLFFWNGNDVADANLIKKGQPVSNITATRWNNLLAKIKELADACGVYFTYTMVSSGDGITAARFNVARNGLDDIATKLGVTNLNLPDTQFKDNTIYASLFTGNGSIKGALSYLIGVYNNG